RELRLRLHGLPVLPRLGDRRTVVAERVERGADVRLERGARVAAARDQVAAGGPELDRVGRRDDRPERMPEQPEALELERLRELVDVARQDRQGQSRRIDAIAAALTPLVDV